MLSSTEFSIIPVMVGRTKAPKNNTNHKQMYTASLEYKNGTGIALSTAKQAMIVTRRNEPRVSYPPRQPKAHPPMNIPNRGAVRQVRV